MAATKSLHYDARGHGIGWPFWFTKGLRVGTKEYLEVMEEVVKPWVDATYPAGNYCWQQDRAPGHKAKATQKWCQENMAGQLLAPIIAGHHTVGLWDLGLC